MPGWTRWEKRPFRLICIGLCVVACVAYATHWAPDLLIEAALAIAMVSGFLDVVIDIFHKQTPDEWAERTRDVFLEIFVAIGIGAALSLFLSIEHHPKQQADWVEEIPKVLGIAVLIFSAKVIADSTGKLRTFGETSASMNTLVKDLEHEKQTLVHDMNIIVEELKRAKETLAHGHYAGMAAKALDIQRGWLEISSAPNPDLPRSLAPALSSIKAWIQRGLRLESTDKINVKRLAWWRAMAIYHQEEVFDIGRSEIATNVRNYAFILIGLISEFLRFLPQIQNQEGKSTRKRKLVVLQVTPFTPKDFYNFPNGTSTRRFYHEAEYFGTYRRVLAVIAADPRVIPARILLVGEDVLETPKTEQEDGLRDLGWELERFYDVVLDSARLNVVPMPVMFQTAHNAAEGGEYNSEPTCDDIADPHIKERLRANFPTGTDPATLLPRGVKRVLWAPTYVNSGNPNHDVGMRYTEREAIRTRWRSKYPAVHHELEEVSKDQQLWAKYLDEDNPGEQLSLFTREREAWYLLIEAFRDRALREGMDKKEEQIEKINLYLTTVSEDKARRSIGDVFQVLGYDITRGHSDTSEVDEVENFLTDLKALNSLSGQCERCRREALETPSVAIEYADSILELVARCQEADSSFQFLQNKFDSLPYATSSSGTNLGFVENWLHRFMIVQEAIRLKTEILKQGPLPLWSLFLSDLLGLDKNLNLDKSKTVTVSGESKEETSPPIMERLRVCPLGKAGQQAMAVKGISPEFLLIGLLDDGPDFSPNGLVEWLVLVRAEISEPFHTCRVSIDFDPNEYAEHVNWVATTWDGAEEWTKKFVAGVEDEAAALRPS
jgi:hypothetical protein